MASVGTLIGALRAGATRLDGDLSQPTARRGPARTRRRNEALGQSFAYAEFDPATTQGQGVASVLADPSSSLLPFCNRCAVSGAARMFHRDGEPAGDFRKAWSGRLSVAYGSAAHSS